MDGDWRMGEWVHGWMGTFQRPYSCRYAHNIHVSYIHVYDQMRKNLILSRVRQVDLCNYVVHAGGSMKTYTRPTVFKDLPIWSGDDDDGKKPYRTWVGGTSYACGSAPNGMGMRVDGNL